MINPFKEVDWNPGIAGRRTFARSLILGFPCVALMWLLIGLLAGKGWNVSPALRIGGIGALTGVVLFVAPTLALPFYRIWYALACCMGFVVGNLLLLVVFYVFVTAIGCLKRVFGSPPVRKLPDKRATTYWQDAQQADDMQRYFRQF